MTIKVVRTINTYEVICWEDENGMKQEEWELVGMEDLKSPKRRYVTETPQQRSKRMSKTAKKMWKKMKGEK